MAEMIPAETIETAVREGKATFVEDFKALVETPSVSSQEVHFPDIQRAAEMAAEYLKKAGASRVEIYQTSGHPVVFGRLGDNPDHPTVAIYNHLDVQPAEAGKDGWTRDPWTFTEENGRYYSRGTTDDKGPALTCLWAARLAREHQVPLNVEFFWEFEEEIGSPHYDEFLRHAKSEGLSWASQVVISDTIWVSPERPAITRSLRGLAAAEIFLRTAKKDAHSGMAGGPARNPLVDLAALVATMVDAKTGEVLVEDFGSTWTPPTEAELQGFVDSGFSVEGFQKAHQLTLLRSQDPRQVTAGIWARPTFEVHGFVGGYQGAGTKTVIPASASVKISCRLVPGQDPKVVMEKIQAHVAKHLPEAEVRSDHSAEPYRIPDEEEPLLEAIQDAMEYAFGTRPVEVNSGGSIGAVLLMKKILEIPVLFLPLSLPEDSYHGPDESYAWVQTEGGVKALVRYFELIAERS